MNLDTLIDHIKIETDYFQVENYNFKANKKTKQQIIVIEKMLDLSEDSELLNKVTKCFEHFKKIKKA